MKMHTLRRFLPAALFVVVLAACSMPMASTSTPELSGDSLRVENVMARPAPGGGNGAAYFTIVNPTESADRLISVQSTVASATELHETTEENGVMRMSPKPDGFEIPARSLVELKPGGKHVMLIGIAEGLAAGDELALSLTFENAGTMDITIPVMEMTGSTMPMATMDHGDGDMAEGAMAADALEPQFTENGIFQVTATSRLDPITINEIHNWLLHVENADGAPVEDAEIAVDGGMPAHNHGFPTTPQVTENLGNGDYLLEGVRFNMTGDWVMDLTISSGEQTDSVRFEFELK